ncbi:unnamed protein product, partial [Rotaria magnacalcarata]
RIPAQSISNNIHPPGSIEDHIDELDDYSSLSSSPIIVRAANAQYFDTAVLSSSNDIMTFDDQRITNIIDQKNYIEELHRNS